MTIRVTIRNEEQTPSQVALAVTVVTVGDLSAAEQKHRVEPQESVTVRVHRGQFVMVDETDSKEGA